MRRFTPSLVLALAAAACDNGGGVAGTGATDGVASPSVDTAAASWPDALAVDAWTTDLGGAHDQAVADASVPDAAPADADEPDGPPPEPLCDGTDDDGDGRIDEGYDCVAGSVIDCTTSCGSSGKAACVEGCHLSTCQPPPEICNGRDDDCDGMLDQGFACIRDTLRLCNPGCGNEEYQTCDENCQWTPCPSAPGCPEDGTFCDDDLDRDGFLDEGALELGPIVGGRGSLESDSAWNIFSEPMEAFDPVWEGGARYVHHIGHQTRTFTYPLPVGSFHDPDDPRPLPDSFEASDSVPTGLEAFAADRRDPLAVSLPPLDGPYFHKVMTYPAGPYLMVDEGPRLVLYDLRLEQVGLPIEPGLNRPEFVAVGSQAPGTYEPVLWPAEVWLCDDMVVCATGVLAPAQIGCCDEIDLIASHLFEPPPADGFHTYMIRMNFATGELTSETVELPAQIGNLGRPSPESAGQPDSTIFSRYAHVAGTRSIRTLAARYRDSEAQLPCRRNDFTTEVSIATIDIGGWHFGEWHSMPPDSRLRVDMHPPIAFSDSLLVIAELDQPNCPQGNWDSGFVLLHEASPPELLGQWPVLQMPAAAPDELPADGDIFGKTIVRWGSHALVTGVVKSNCPLRCQYQDELNAAWDLSCCVNDHTFDELRQGATHRVIISANGQMGANYGVPRVMPGVDGLGYLDHEFSGGARLWGDYIQAVLCSGERRTTRGN